MTDRYVHQVRVLYSLHLDNPLLCTGFGVDRRPVGEDTWRPYASAALEMPTPIDHVMIMAEGYARDAAQDFPVVLPFE